MLRSRQWRRRLRRFWWLPLLTLTLFQCTAAIYLQQRALTYVSQASLWETAKLRLPDSALIFEGPQNYLGNQTELLKSEQLQRLAWHSLETNPATVGAPVRRNWPPKVTIAVREAPKSSVVMVEASGSNPECVQAYLDALLRQYLQFKKELRELVSSATQASVSAQLQRLNSELTANLDALAAFERTNNPADLQAEGALAGGYLIKLQTQLSEYQLESRLLESADLEPGQNLDEAVGATAAGAGSPGGPFAGLVPVATPVAGAGRQVALLKLQRERLSQYLRPQHPKIRKLDEAIDDAQKVLDLDAAQSDEQLGAARRSLKLKCDNVRTLIQEWQAKVVAVDGRIAEADRLKLNVNRTQNLYDRLALLLQSVNLSRDVDPDALAILQPASPARRSYAPELVVLALAWPGGLGAGLGLVLLLTRHDDRFASVGEMDASLAGAVLGVLPEMKSARTVDLPLLESKDARHVYAESYRGLRSALLHLPGPGAPPKVILLTSAMPREGKSTIAANLAQTLAWGGLRVLLVDASLGENRLPQLLGRPGEPGLVELLRQPDRWRQFVQPGAVATFAFLPRGNGDGHTSDLFLGPAWEEVLRLVRPHFDQVLIDGSPVLVAADAGTLAPRVDGALLVVRGNYSSARLVRAAFELLHRRQAAILGLVFNRAVVPAGSHRDLDRYFADFGRAENHDSGSVPGSRR